MEVEVNGNSKAVGFERGKPETRLFIDNEFITGKAGRTFKLYNPVSDDEVCQVHEALPEDVNYAVEAAQRAFPRWSALSANERALPMFKLAQLIQRDAEELAYLDAICMGKPVELLKKMDVPGCAGVFNYFAGSAFHIIGESSTSSANFLNVSIRQPYGVVGLIIPWNVPMIMFAFKVAPALICGNTVVLKSAEKAPLSVLKLASLMKEAGFSSGVVNVLSGFGDPTGVAIALHMKIRKISFTGSVAIGKKIMRYAAESNLKNVSLELGGKGAAIIFEDADITAAAKYTHYSINHNSGQHCQANSRVLVHRSIVNEYLAQLKHLMSRVTIGDPLEPKTFQGPQVDVKQMHRIQSLIDAGANDGQLVHGGHRIGTKASKASADEIGPVLAYDQQGAFMEPTILFNVPQTSEAYQEEIFGPVVIVNTFETEEEVLKEANCTEFGLFSSVYTKDFDRAIRIARGLETGAVGINCSVPLRAVDMPIGGWKQSGIGRELSLHGLNLYTELKTVYMKFGQDPTSMSSCWHCS